MHLHGPCRGAKRALVPTLTCLLAAGLIACGSDDESEQAVTTGTGTTARELGAIKDYLVSHSEELVEQVEILRANGEEYHELAESLDFDYERLMNEKRDEVEKVLTASKEAFVRANPAYEEMEGIVAGVPRLAQYDVDIDAGSDSSDPENAVSFSLETPSGETLKQPGNLFFLTETALYGTNDDLLAEGVEGDVDGSGEVEFGEGLPDADTYVATVRKFDEMSKQLLEDAQKFEPTESDAFTAITVMTSTMSEYFEAWKNSRFIAGEDAEEAGFVAVSRLSDIADILSGIQFTYNEIEPMISEEDQQLAEQTEESLAELVTFVEDLRDREAEGEEFTAEQADSLGSEAQNRAEEIAGQVTQAAKRLGVELQDA